MKKIFSVLILAILFFSEAALASSFSYHQYLRSLRGNDNYKVLRYYDQSDNKTATLGYAPRLTYRQRLQRTYTRFSKPVERRGKTVYSIDKNTTIPLRAIINPINNTRAIGSGETRKVMTIGLFNNAPRGKRVFREAITNTEIFFRISDKLGLRSDFSDIEIVTDTRRPSFPRSGKTSIRIDHSRLASNESISLNISLRNKNENIVDNLTNPYSLEVVKIIGYGELTGDPNEAHITGRKNSHSIVFDNRSYFLGENLKSTLFSTTPSITIDRFSIAENQDSYVLQSTFRAAQEDALIEKLTVYNQYGDGADRAIKFLQAIDLDTGSVLDQRSIYNGRATFTFRPSLRVYRERPKSIGFKAVPQSRGTGENTLLKLGIDAGESQVIGFSSNARYNTSAISTYNNANDFFIARSYPVVSSGLVQPNLVVNGQLTNLFEVNLKNHGPREIEIGRLSFSLHPSHVDYPGGASTDDFDIGQKYRSGSITSLGWNASINGNTVHFDSSRSFYLPAGQSVTLVFRAALVRTDTSAPSIVVQLLGDNSLQTGTLTSLRSAGKNFIWSDIAANNHSNSTDDWLTGYQILGLPTQSKSVKE